jgi:integrase/recombinase XerD
VRHLVGKGFKPATMPLTVPARRGLEARRGERIEGPLILRPRSDKPPAATATAWSPGIAKAPASPRHVGPHPLRQAAITNASAPECPCATHRYWPPRRPTHHELYDRARGNLDRHGSTSTA